jgi:hypothetical protein
MSGKRHMFGKGLQAGLLLSLLVIVFLAARTFVPLQQGAVALRRLAIAASMTSNDLIGLGLISAGAGLFVVSDRRRRARGRQASS